MRNNTRKQLQVFLPLLLALAVLLGFLAAVSRLDAGNRREEQLRLEETLKRAAIACYSLEGAYPVSAEALAASSGLSWNTNHYDVKYEYCGSNLMPDITVLIRRK
ncbi:MAG: hypothetical protein E7662_03285 [Ruminococcaceae bacterium]|nr:hypothetical protein [Oscillospiraceae bacterium]